MTAARSSIDDAKRWGDAYASALLGGDREQCQRLLAETASLPSAFAAIVEGHVRPAAECGIGRSEQASALLTAHVHELRPHLAAALDGGPGALATQEDLKTGLQHALTAVWLDASGGGTSAAASYYEAGKFLGWAGESVAQLSFDLLTRANILDQSHVDTYWLLANALFGRSFTEPAALQHSLEVWNRGAALRLPSGDSSWAYVLRGLLSEEFARADDPHRVKFWWEGVVFLERAILLNDRDGGRWANLGRLHRFLENEFTCLQATGQGVQRDATHLSVLEERAAVLANAGINDDALTHIDARLETDRANPWALGVKAYILMHQKAYRAAADLIDEVIAVQPTNLWNWDVRATCCRMLGETEAARAAYERIVQSRAPGMSNDDLRTCAYAAFNLGRADDAIKMIEEASSTSTGHDADRLLGLCYLATGRIARAEELLLCAIAQSNVRELDDLLTIDLPVAERALAALPPPAGATATARRIKRVAEALLAELRRAGLGDVASEAEQELRTVLDAYGSDASDAWKVVGAGAGLARLQLESGRWHDAAAHYRALGNSTLFPEAGLGVERAADGLRAEARRHAAQRQYEGAARAWRQLLVMLGDAPDPRQLTEVHREIGDALWSTGDASGALAAFDKSLAILPAGSEPATEASIRARSALARQQLGDLPPAYSDLVAALQLFAAVTPHDPGRSLGDVCRTLLRDLAHCWQVEGQWTEFERASATADLRRQFAAARQALLVYFDDRFHLGVETKSDKAIPVVTPIALDVGADLVPLVDPKKDRAFIHEEIPAMRERVQTDMGMHRVPGILVREDPAASDAYVILLDGAPVARGNVRLGQRYCPLAAALVAESGVVTGACEEVVDPVTDMPGAWYPDASWEALKARGLTLMTETQYILRHVEDVLRHHLDGFLGIQEAEDSISRAAKDVTLSPAVRSSLEQPRPRLLFARALRALARERVPLADGRALADGAAAAGWTNVPDIVREVRLRMKTQLPGNDESTTLLRLPDSFAATVVSPRAALALLSVLRQWLLPYTTPVGIVTTDATSRLLVRRLLEGEFPGIAVLSQQEVAHPDRVVPLSQESVAAVEGLS